MEDQEINILLVEDNPGDARLILEMFKERKRFPCSVKVAETLVDAVNKLNEHHFDNIILDLNLPDSGGLETLDIIIQKTGDIIPVIVLTGLNDEEIGLSAIERGAEDYFVKNEVNPSHLARSVQYAIERKKMVNSLKDSEERFRRLHESMIDAFVQVDMNGAIVAYNNTYINMLGYSPDELKQLTYIDLTPEKWHDFENDILKNQILKNGFSEIYEKEYYRKDRAVLQVELRTSLLFDKDNKPSGMWAIVRDITERKKTQAELLKREMEYRTLIETTPCVICKIDPDGTTLFVNNFVKTVTGYSVEEIVGRNWWDLFYPGDFNIQSTSLIETVRTGDVEGYEMTLQGSDGCAKTILWSSFNKYGENSELIEINGVGIDITSRKQAEIDLVESEHRLKQAQKVARVGDWDFDLSSNKMTWSDQVYSMYERDPALGPPDVDEESKYYTPEQAAELRRISQEVIDSGAGANYEFSAILKSGTTPVFAGSMRAVKDISGRVTSLYGTIQDITEKKFAENLLAVRLELLTFSESHTLDDLMVNVLDKIEKFTGSSISFFHFVDADQVNLTFQEWSTRTKNEFCMVEGKGLHYSISEAGVWADSVRERKPVIHNDYSSMKTKRGLPDGHAPVIREMVIPIIRDDAIKAILGVGNKITDYTERDESITEYIADILWNIVEKKQAEESLRQLNAELETRVADRTYELEKANRELEMFSYSVSHDLRAPLRHIKGFIEMIKNETAGSGNEKVDHYINVVSTSAEHMGQLIQDLLSFSRMGRAVITKHTVNMELLLDDVLKEYSDDLQTGNVSVIRHPLPEVNGDRAMLQVVLVNLISNAIKFSSKSLNPEVEIGSTSENSRHTFYVRDNGVGFDMRYSETLFGIFKRLHNETDFPGTGIGLAMIKNIIERHNGEVRAESEPGKGACFYFVLPA